MTKAIDAGTVATPRAGAVRLLVAVFLLLPPGWAAADSPAPPHSYEQPTSDKRHVFVMLAPSERNVTCPGHAVRCRYSQSGLYRSDGSPAPLWTVDWYSSHVMVSADARHLVRFPSWTGRGPGAHALAFFADGKEIRSYRVSELVSTWRGVVETVSHMWWIKDLKLDEGLKRLTLTAATKDVTVFDITTGDIVSAVRSRHCEPEGTLAREPVAPGDCAITLKRAGRYSNTTLASGTEVVVGEDKTLKTLRAARVAPRSAYGAIPIPPGSIVLGSETVRLSKPVTAGGLTLSGDVRFYSRDVRGVSHVIPVRKPPDDVRTWFGVPFSAGKVSVFGVEADDVAFNTADAKVLSAEFGARTLFKGVEVAGWVELEPDGTPVGSRRAVEQAAAAKQPFDRRHLEGLWAPSTDGSRVCRDGELRFRLSLSADGKVLTTRTEEPRGAAAVSNTPTESAQVVATTANSLTVVPLGRADNKETMEFSFIAPGVFRTTQTPPTSSREMLGVRCSLR